MIPHSIRAVSAWLLTLLVALPFTAPFSSCDISMLLGTAPLHHTRARVSADAAATSIEAAATESESGSVLEEEFKDAIIAPALAEVVTDLSIDAPDHVEFRATVPRQPLVALRL